ncbi:MAG: T9SS type A sorting domain-containing protein [Bacteroidetes bacterium]|nr:T9SS type A sorting domain-containing protein [Bacteroidota bacterium]
MTLLFSVSSAFAATITVQLRDYLGNTVPGAGSASLQVYDGGWSSKTNDGSGNFTVTTSSSGSLIYQLSYNNGVQSKTVSTSTTTVQFTTVNVDVALQNCGGNALSGGTFQFYQNGWSGVKNANTFEELLPGSYTFQMKFNNGIETKSSVAISGSQQQVLFSTTAATVYLRNCNGNALSGGTFQYYQNGWSGVKNANTSEELLPGNYTFQMKYNNGIETQSNVVIANCLDDVLFQTSKVTVALKDCSGNQLSGGTFQYYQNGWSGVKNANTDEELLAGTYTFQMKYNNGVETQSSVAISGCTDDVLFQTSKVTIALKDCSGNALSGGTFQYYQNGWSGVKNANTDEELLAGNYTFQMKYNNGVETKSGVVISGCTDDVLFTTSKVTIALKDCSGNQLSGGTFQYYQNGWSGVKTANTNEELLAGNYTFQMKYNNGVETKSNVSVSGCTSSITFTATKVEINYSGTIQHYQNGWGTYSNPKYFLPGNYTFTFNGSNSTNIAISGCSMAKTAVIVKLISSTNAPIANGAVQHYSGGWQNAGVTPANGNLLVLLDGLNPGNRTFSMTHAFARQEKTQNVTSNNVVTFQTTNVKIELRDHNNNLLGEGSNLQYYAGGWRTFGSGSTTGGDETMELLPLNYTFALSYGFARQEKTQNVGTTNPVVFKTELVTMELRDHSNNLLGEGSSLQYYAGGWRTFGSGGTTGGDETMEMLPMNYTFALSYGYARQEKTQNTGTNSTVVFKTELVTMELRDHNYNLLGEGSGLQYYAGGWRTFGSGATTGGDETMELLPMNYTFALSHGFARQEKTQNVGTNSTVVFETELVTMELRDHSNNLLSEGSSLQYYAGGWRTFGSGSTTGGDETMEMLPMNYTFAMSYGNARKEMTQNVGTNPTVTFSTTLVTVRLTNASSSLLNGGSVSYYAGGWQSFGTTGASSTGECEKEMFPGSISFKMVYSSLSKEKVETINNATDLVIFIYNGSSISREIAADNTVKDKEINQSEALVTKDAKVQTTVNTSVTGSSASANSGKIAVVQSLTSYPNPFTSTATIGYELKSKTPVNVGIYNTNGALVKSLQNGIQEAGTQQVTLTSENLAGGLYYVRVITNHGVQQIPVVLNK